MVRPLIGPGSLEVPVHIDGSVHGNQMTINGSYVNGAGQSQSFADTLTLGKVTHPPVC